MNPIRHQHSGDLGDIVSCLPIIRQLGAGDIVLAPYTHRHGIPRERMTEERANFILPLLAAQSYITGASFEAQPKGITHDHSGYRTMGRKRPFTEMLAHWQARYMGIIDPKYLDLSPWLKAQPSEKTHGKIIVARSPRYHNPHFPWRKLLRLNRADVVFMGLPHEHAALCQIAGFRIPAARVGTALDMARLIAGCKLFIGNQSFPCWIAMGLGHPLIQETCPEVPDSIVPRANARFIMDAADVRTI